MPRRFPLVVFPLMMLASTWFAVAGAQAQGRTDVVTLANGDRMTGEVVALERGRLTFKTDDAGTLYFEWDKLTSVVTLRLVEVVTTDDRRFLGSLERAPDRSIVVAGLQDRVALP